MPRAHGSIELAQARLSARFGALPDEVFWARVGGMRDHAMLLDALRGSTFARWMRGVLPSHGVHSIESHLRNGWRDEVRQVASWMPPAWQRPVTWWRPWLDLPVLQHLARGHAPPAWMVADLVDESRRLRSVLEQPDAIGAWLASWRALWPDAHAAVLPELARAIARAHTQHPGAHIPVMPRRALRRTASLLFRRAMLEPATAFCYLVALAVDVERLRGELVRSAVFSLPVAA